MAEPAPTPGSGGGAGAGGRFAPGDRVRARPVDPAHHTRLPRYARGHVGVVERAQPAAVLPDDSARGLAAPRVERVYTVVFAARELWGPQGEGGHAVTLDLWESYLEPAPEGPGEPGTGAPVGREGPGEPGTGAPVGRGVPR